MFEELRILSVERQFYSELFNCENPSRIFACLERSVKQLVSFDGLYIHYNNPLYGVCEKLSGPRSQEIKSVFTSKVNFLKPDGNWFPFTFGEDHGAKGSIIFTTKNDPSPGILCSVERMLNFCSKSLYQYELLQRIEQYGKEQELLLRELRHRTHNNLQFMLGTLPYLVPDSEGVSQELREKIEQRLHGLIVLSSIWDTQSIDAAVSAPSYFVSVARTLRKLWLEDRGSLELSIQVDESLVLSKGIATTIGLISNELITNTIKHGSYDFPIIHISIQQQEKHLLYSYKERCDAACGDAINHKDTAHENSPSYLPDCSARGQGHGIIQGLVEKAGGIILSEKVPGRDETGGYHFSAAFPLKQD
jgi:two-component sensor histidine kinase